MQKTFDIVCSLVRNRVFGASEEIPSGVNWDDVYKCSIRQEVSAICYEAVKNLPQDRQPSFGLMLNWDISAQAIREMHFLRLKAAKEVCAILETEGIKLVMLKGLSLAHFYPEPSERESADIDILTFHDREKVDKIMERQGIEVSDGEHHTTFIFDGITFENHGTDVKWDLYFRKSDYRVTKLIDSHADKVQLGPEGFLVLSPTDTAVFLISHLKRHLRWNIKVNVKQFTDLALLLQAYPEIIEMVLSDLKSVGLCRFGKTMMRVSEKVTGVNLNIKTDILSKVAAALTVKFILPIHSTNHPLFIYSFMARDLIVSKRHRKEKI